MDQPEGFIKHGEEEKVHRLNKALHGLKQAPRTWFSRIDKYFQREGFLKSKHDHTLFIERRERENNHGKYLC